MATRSLSLSALPVLLNLGRYVFPGSRSRFLRRSAIPTLLASRWAWTAVPLFGGLAYWGLRAWRNQSRGHELMGKNPQTPIKDTAAPEDLVDESIWESFPASDPPSTTPRTAAK